MEALSKDENLSVRIALVRNSHTPARIIRYFAETQLSEVDTSTYPPDTMAYALAQNPKTPNKTLAELSKRDDPKIVDSITKNEGAPAEVTGIQTFYENQYLEVNKPITYIQFKIK
jgi:hypothetical protein